MKKATILSSLTLLTALCLVSCKKESVSAPEEASNDIETPLKTAVEAKSPADSLYAQGNAPANFGFKFKSSMAGTIRKLGCRMPNTGTYTVTLWNLSNGQPMAQALVNVTNGGQFTYAGVLPAVAIDANTSYVISVNNTSGGVAKPYYQMFKKPNTVVNLYPFTKGHITIEAPVYKSGLANAMPDYNNASDFPFLRGIADFEIDYRM